MNKKTEIERLEIVIENEKIFIKNLSEKLNKKSRNLFKLQSQLNELRSNS